MARGVDKKFKGQAVFRFLCAAIAGTVFTNAFGQTVGWYPLELEGPFGPPPASFVIAPTNPTSADTINFVAPAWGGAVFLNSTAADDMDGVPGISLNSTSQTISVTFSAATDYPIPQIAYPVSGVDGQFGPIAGGTWTFNVVTNIVMDDVTNLVTNAYPFTVTGPPLGIVATSSNLVITWKNLAGLYGLQSTTDLKSGNWSNVTNGITTDGTNYVFNGAMNNHSAYFRLQQQ
jgi:hypothetical protein